MQYLEQEIIALTQYIWGATLNLDGFRTKRLSRRRREDEPSTASSTSPARGPAPSCCRCPRRWRAARRR